MNPDQRNRLLAGIVGAFLGCLMLLATATILQQSRTDVDGLAYGDGLIYRYVAANLDAAPGDVHPVVTERGTSLRYGRVGLPLMIWILSAGRAEVMPVAQVVIMILSAGASGMLVCMLIPRLGALAGVIPFLAPGFGLAVSGGFAEAPAVAALLAGIWLVGRHRYPVAAVVFAFAMLARENTAAIVAFLVLGCVLTQGRRSWVLVTAFIPVSVWYAVVWMRFGHIPPLDPYLRSTTETVGPPVVAFIRSLTDPASSAALIALLVHLAAATVCVMLLRRSPFAALGVVAALQLLISGRFAWEIVGEAFRTPVFLQVFTVLTLWTLDLGRAGRRRVSPQM